MTEEIIAKFHGEKFEELRRLLKAGKPVYDFEKKVFVVLADSELVEQFCERFSHKPVPRESARRSQPTRVSPRKIP